MSNLCAKEACCNLAYTRNSFMLSTLIGRAIIYLCDEHFAELMRAHLEAQLLRIEQKYKEEQEA